VTLVLPPGRYPHLMPLPTWAADVARQLEDTESLVLLEGKFQDEPPDYPPVDVLVLAKLDEVPSVRFELHLLAVILDTEMESRVTIDPEKTTVYSLSTLEGGEERTDPKK
jgi:hypothetical protein